jgi:C1A family cysteine protease
MPKRTKAYFKSLGTGYRFDPYDGRDRIFLAPPRILPKHIDNREECTPVRNQGTEGSCTGHAMVASERWAYEKAKLHDEWEGTDYEGSSIRGAVKAWAKEGICPEESWPYKAKNPGKPKPDAGAKAGEYPIAKYERCLGIDHIKHAIHYRGCVIAGANVHKGWFSTIGKETIPFKPDYSQEGGHAITLVGYDDEKEVFWVKNSWGEEWGKEGFAGLTYKDALVNIRDVWMASIPD